MENIKVNKIPSPTWNWLKMNEADVKDIVIPQIGEVINNIALKESEVVKDAYRYEYKFRDGLVEAVRVDMEKGSEATVIMDMTSDDSDMTAAVKFEYDLKEGANLTLIQVQEMGAQTKFFNDIEGKLDVDAKFNLIQIFLGGQKTYIGAKGDLIGKGAKLNIDSAYLLTDDRELDINYVANHIGKRTECNMKTDGVLRGNAKKIYRGTIDFKRGCAGAIGNETEDVLLMDESVENKTIPVILCAEEDVEGNHGATIGKLDDTLLFYMKSRGIDEKDIYEMMAKARIEAVAKLIDDEKIRNRFIEEVE